MSAFERISKFYDSWDIRDLGNLDIHAVANTLWNHRFLNYALNFYAQDNPQVSTDYVNARVPYPRDPEEESAVIYAFTQGFGTEEQLSKYYMDVTATLARFKTLQKWVTNFKLDVSPNRCAIAEELKDLLAGVNIHHNPSDFAKSIKTMYNDDEISFIAAELKNNVHGSNLVTKAMCDCLDELYHEKIRDVSVPECELYTFTNYKKEWFDAAMKVVKHYSDCSEQDKTLASKVTSANFIEQHTSIRNKEAIEILVKAHCILETQSAVQGLIEAEKIINNTFK